MSSADITEGETENLNRFNGILDGLPTRTKLTISSLCLLDNVSTQLLRFLVFNSNAPQVIALYIEQGTYLSSGETEVFQTLLQLFKQVRLVYNTRSPLLHVHDVAPGLWFPNSPPPSLLRGHEAYIITAIRKANLLTFILTTLGCFSYGFELLQSSFLDIFCPNTLFTGTSSTDQNGKFLKSQAILYLDLKTQAFIAGLRDEKGDGEEIPIDKKLELLQEIFPSDLSEQLIMRRTGKDTVGASETLTPSEGDFLDRCDRRRENLSNFTEFKALTQAYDWSHFIKELLDYCNRNMGLIVWGRRGRGKSPLFTFDKDEFDSQVLYASGAAAPSAHYRGTASTADDDEFEGQDSQLDSDLVHPALSSGAGVANFAAISSFSNQPLSASDGKRVTQSLVSAAIAASANSGIKKLKPKRTWSKEENDALIEGLKAFGPSWSKILDNYGPGGKVSEDLKNRTQVQLKDKARNWKLHYLKAGKELPDYLSKVTGNIAKVYKSKKRAAPSGTDITSAIARAASSQGTPARENSNPPNSQSEAIGESMDDSVVGSGTTQKDIAANNLFVGDSHESPSYDPNLENGM